MSEIVQAILRRHQQMVSERGVFESRWTEVVNYLLPNRGTFNVKMPQGTAKSPQYIYDSTGTEALEILASALHGMLTSPSIPWFILQVADPVLAEARDVKIWLEMTQRTILDSLHQSNFVTAMQEFYNDFIGFGTGCMYVESDPVMGLNFHVPFLGELYLSANRYKRIDTVHRVFDMTARQMVQTWGLEGVSGQVKRVFQFGPERKFEVLHAVFPRKDSIKGISSKGKEFASFYLEMDTKHILSESGYDTMPYMCPRWSVMSGETYGRGPGLRAMPDIKMLQAIVKTGLRGAQKAVDPPIQVPDNMVAQRLKLYPGGVNRYRSGSQDRIEPVGNYGANLAMGLEVEERWRQAIKRSFYNDLLQLSTEKQMRSAAEAMIRKDDQTQLVMLILGPVFGRFMVEFLNPLLNRVMTILADDGKLPPRPPYLEEVQIRYISPIARAQHQTEVQSIRNYIEHILPLAQIQPEIMDRINPDGLSRLIAADYGVPVEVLRTDEEVRMIREQRRQMAEAQQIADIAKKGGQALRSVGGADAENLEKVAGLLSGKKVSGVVEPEFMAEEGIVPEGEIGW